MSSHKEIGGYLSHELLTKTPTVSNSKLLFNTGRSSLAYILFFHKINYLQIPYYTCDAVLEPLKKLGIKHSCYRIEKDLTPSSELDFNQPFLINNYFGILDTKLNHLSTNMAIVDNAQALYSRVQGGLGSFNSFRKFIGISDGSEASIPNHIDIGYNEFSRFNSAKNWEHLIGRIESGAETYFSEYQKSEEALRFSEIKKISKSSLSAFCHIDHAKISTRRKENFNFLHSTLSISNELVIDTEIVTPLVYPYLIDRGKTLKAYLISNRIFIPSYWSNSRLISPSNSLEAHLNDNLVPIPIDQRYGIKEMDQILTSIANFEKQ